jgi:hypothetical protein
MEIEDKTIRGELERLAEKVGGLGTVPGEAFTAAQEELQINYVLGVGRFSPDGRYINIDCKAYKINGEPYGTYVGVDHPVFKNVGETFARPAPPRPPFDRPEGPVDHIQPLSFSKGLRTYPDGSTITAVGPANLHVIQYPDGAHQFWVTGSLIITNGTGIYRGARGLKTVGGSTWVEPGKPLTALDEFSVKTVEVYRIIRAEFIRGR